MAIEPVRSSSQIEQLVQAQARSRKAESPAPTAPVAAPVRQTQAVPVYTAQGVTATPSTVGARINLKA